MAKYHVNSAGEAGVCKAKTGACPFGDAVDHYASADEARAAFEKANAESYWRPTRRGLLEKLELKASSFLKDYVRIDLADDGKSITTLSFRVLPGKIIWPQWRENLYIEGRPPAPKGAHNELQDRVLKLLPGWKLASNPLELSSEGKAFRERYLASHPQVVWELDRNLESDDGTPEATPHITRKEFAAEVAGTPLAKLLKL